jgi:fructokinase
VRIGIDLGGTKTEIVVLDSQGREALRERTNTPSHSYDAIVATIKDLVNAAETKLGTGKCSVGIGIPGAISPATGLIKNANTTCLIGRAFDKDLERELGRPVKLANDANCFALSEATDGAAAGAAVVFGVIVGTGTGGGVVVNGAVVNGRNLIAGEWGHNPLPWPLDEERPGPKCYCGKHGCIETFLSGPGLKRDHEGGRLETREIVARAASGDVAAESTLRRYEDRMARSLASVINVLDPDIVVLGGGLSNLPRLYENVPKIWRKYVFSDEVTTRLVPAKFGDSSGVRGAAWL